MPKHCESSDAVRPAAEDLLSKGLNHICRFFSTLLDADTNTYTAMGAEYSGRVYRDGDMVPDDQRIGETVAREFIIDDTQQLPTLATEEDDD